MRWLVRADDGDVVVVFSQILRGSRTNQSFSDDDDVKVSCHECKYTAIITLRIQYGSYFKIVEEIASVNNS